MCTEFWGAAERLSWDLITADLSCVSADPGRRGSLLAGAIGCSAPGDPGEQQPLPDGGRRPAHSAAHPAGPGLPLRWACTSPRPGLSFHSRCPGRTASRFLASPGPHPSAGCFPTSPSVPSGSFSTEQPKTSLKTVYVGPQPTHA